MSALSISCSSKEQLSERQNTGSSDRTIGSNAQENTGFGIFLAETNELILSDKHIKSYDKNTHEIELNAEGIKKWKSYIPYDKSFDPPIPKLGGLYQKEFVVSIDGKEMYRGTFWSRLSSAGYSGIVILDVIGPLENKISIDFGNPGSFRTKEQDPRNNPEIIDYFRKRNLLK